MPDTRLLKNSSTSYSQFLKSKDQHAHYLNEQTITSPVDFDFFHRFVTLHYPFAYAEKKWQNIFYRSIFFGFSILFFILGIMIFFKTTNPSCSIYFGNCSIIKNWVNFLCVILAVGSFALGYIINPEKEAIKYLVNRVKNELTAPALQIKFHAMLSNQIESNQDFWIKKIVK